MQNLQLATTIKFLCKKREIAINTLITTCSLTKSIIYDLEKRDKTPSVDKIERIADFFNVSIDYLLGRTQNPEINNAPYVEEIPKNIIKIPLENLSVSAGPGLELVDDFDNVENEYIEIDADDFPKVDRAFRVRGNSMEPKYHDDDIVLVKSQSVLENGEIGIFILNNNGYIKKFHIDENNNRTLVSLNKDYLPIHLGLTDDVIVVGKVLCTL